MKYVSGNGLTDTPVFGQAKIAVTNTAVQLTSQALSNGIIITAKASNTASIEIGSSNVNTTTDGTGNGYILSAGATVSAAILNPNLLWINGTSGDVVSWIGS